MDTNRLLLLMALPYLELLERGESQSMDANMAEDLPHIVRLVKSVVQLGDGGALTGKPER